MYVDFLNPLLAFVVCEAISRRLGWMTYPRYPILSVKSQHLFILGVVLAMQRSVSTVRPRRMCSSEDLEKITMSTKYTREILPPHCK